MQGSVDANPGLVNAARQPCVNCETSAALNTPPESHIHGIPAWRGALIWPVAALVRLWLATIRFQVPEPDRAVITYTERPTIFILWHNRLFLASEIARRFRAGQSLYGLVSASKDGAWLAAFFSAVGMGSIRGSSSRLGKEAATASVAALRSGNDVGITPDGPRGPVYELKPGALIVARRAGTRVVLVGIDFESSWRLASWDGFHLPKPFSRVTLCFETIGPEELKDRDQAASALGARLVQMNPDRKPAPVRRRA
jgi:lysophospholipid acyltransferase (LPLAT)-like uncharacterized protein